MIQFFAPDILSNPVLPESDSQHCIKVLRRQVGDRVDVIDGRGTHYVCRIVDAHPKHAMLEIIESEEQPLPWSQRITLAIAPTKHLDRMEWLVEKLVEIGINRIVPLRCDHSERRELKEERLQKIAVSAMKQSLKAVLPEITPMVGFRDFIGDDTLVSPGLMHAIPGDTEVSPPVPTQRFVAYCNDEIPRVHLSQLYVPHRDVTILIGPEGDFSSDEIHAAFDAGYQPVTLGDNRLRTETAALYAVTAMHILDSTVPIT